MPKLLIIEDHACLRESLRIAFEGDDIEVRCAKDAEEGLICIGGWMPDVVVLDYTLPGLDGLELIKRIKDIARAQCIAALKPRIIMISAMMNRELMEKALAAGADWCMSKPFDLVVLRMIVYYMICI